MAIGSLFPDLSSWENVRGGTCLMVGYEGGVHGALALRENSDEVLVFVGGGGDPKLVKRTELQGLPFTLGGVRAVAPPDDGRIVQWTDGDPVYGVLAIARSGLAYVSAFRGSGAGPVWIDLQTGEEGPPPDDAQMIGHWRFIFKEQSGRERILFSQP